ncbi:hypothetical protein Xen7305DRAFT_00052340 [Xenococcus sp. PCC 7305]|uniref:hypothetical protein n=1 Tax=Xenococcus sp. PCC 7305 TaxID=102125 RepID=UPI0002AC6413|nr:hypothetical protein [Xenococcus sp. PCC 7305]ELS05488.1 hypothetical protein Xen7305DRAFT_00052340 [Xenococcus sp. PCC 7305]
MSNDRLVKPIGEILQNAGLVSPSQIEVALHDQTYYQDMRIGEILALRGWIEQSTVDFFAQEWVRLLRQKDGQPLGFYLKRASLLTEKQIEMILAEQNQTCLRFGATAVLKGFVKKNTIDFFLTNLFPEQAISSSYITRTFDRTTEIVDPSDYYNNDETISQEDITYWVRLSEQKITSGA